MRNIRSKLLLATIGIIGFGGHSTFAASSPVAIAEDTPLPGEVPVSGTLSPQPQSTLRNLVPAGTRSEALTATGDSGTTAAAITPTDSTPTPLQPAGAASLTVATTGGSGTDTAIPVADKRPVDQRFSDTFTSLDSLDTSAKTRTADLSAILNVLSKPQIIGANSIQRDIYNYLDRTIIHPSTHSLRDNVTELILSPEVITGLIGLVATTIFVKYATDDGYLSTDNQYNIMSFSSMLFGPPTAHVLKYCISGCQTCSSCCRSTPDKLSRKWKGELSNPVVVRDITRLLSYSFAHQNIYVPEIIESTLERLLLENDDWDGIGEALFPR